MLLLYLFYLYYFGLFATWFLALPVVQEHDTKFTEVRRHANKIIHLKCNNYTQIRTCINVQFVQVFQKAPNRYFSTDIRKFQRQDINNPVLAWIWNFVTVTDEDHLKKLSNEEITAAAQAGKSSVFRNVSRPDQFKSVRRLVETWWCSSRCHHWRAERAKQWRQEDRGRKIEEIDWIPGFFFKKKAEHDKERGRVSCTCCGLMRAGEEEDGALPTTSDEGQADPCDSSLWCCSGDKLSLLLSSSNA